MKAKIDNTSYPYKVTLDNEAIKAIRFCLGLNTDCRVSVRKHENLVCDFISSHSMDIFGVDFYEPKMFSPEYEKWRTAMRQAAQIVVKY